MNSDPDDLLSFKDFPETHGNFNDNSQAAQISINSPVHSSNFSSSSSAAINNNGSSNLLTDLVNDMSKSVKFLNDEESRTHQGNEFNDNDNNTDSDKQIYSFWSIEYYQQYFNVDTLMVIDRIVNSIIPKRAPTNYLKSYIGLNPDLYGPFWITVTLIFSIAISGNIASYLQHANDDYKWRYDFHLVSYAATAIFTYAFIIPLILWITFKWSLKPITDDLESESCAYTPSLLSLTCVYGYSLSIYIPVSILWVIQISYLQWLLVLTAAFLSGSVLIFVLSPALRNSKLSLILIIAIATTHFLLAAGFMWRFFHMPHTTIATESVTLNITEKTLEKSSVIVEHLVNSTKTKSM